MFMFLFCCSFHLFFYHYVVYRGKYGSGGDNGRCPLLLFKRPGAIQSGPLQCFQSKPVGFSVIFSYFLDPFHPNFPYLNVCIEPVVTSSFSNMTKNLPKTTSNTTISDHGTVSFSRYCFFIPPIGASNRCKVENFLVDGEKVQHLRVRHPVYEGLSKKVGLDVGRERPEFP